MEYRRSHLNEEHLDLLNQHPQGRRYVLPEEPLEPTYPIPLVRRDMTVPLRPLVQVYDSVLRLHPRSPHD